jgi:uncharacterized membrane protein YfcA
MLVAAVALGAAVGLVLGALGGGGSVLTVPALVFVLGLTAQEATTGSLVIVGITAAAAAIGHARAGHVQWKHGLLLAAAGVPAALLGTAANRLADQNVLLLAFAALMLVAAIGMLITSPGSDGDASDERDDGPWGGRLWSRVLGAGLLIGALTGFFGVGGGFVIVPVLVVALHFPIATAVGTSLVVIALNSGVSLAARLGSVSIAWDVIAPFTAAAVVGSFAGKRVADRLPAAALTRAFAVLLVLVAGYVAVRAVLGLT